VLPGVALGGGVAVYDRLKIAIVASGPSAHEIALPEDVHVIAVNGAIDWIERADSWFTLDPSPENVRRMKRPRPGVQYYAATDHTCPPLPQHVRRLRRVRANAPEPKDRASAEWLLWRNSAALGLAPGPTSINTGNSAYGALGLAFHMRPKLIALFGVDGTTDGRCEGGSSGDLRHLPLLFASACPQLAAAGITVLNGSPESRVGCFPKTLREVALRWISQ
jgi:hypothetical protein